MARQVTVNVDNVVVDGAEHDSGDVVIISDAEFNDLTAAGRFTDGTLTDGGAHAEEGDNVSTQGAAVAAPAALTSAPAAGATPTKAEFDALQADVAALRTTVLNLRNNLTGTGLPLAP